MKKSKVTGQITIPVTCVNRAFSSFYTGGELRDKAGRIVGKFGVALGGGTIYLFHENDIGHDTVQLKDIVSAMVERRRGAALHQLSRDDPDE